MTLPLRCSAGSSTPPAGSPCRPSRPWCWRASRRSRTPDSSRRTLRWSNAGHLPPVLLLPDGTSRLLEADEDLLLGVDPDTPRTDHTVQLPDHSTLLMFTDGLIERRSASLDDGLARLQAALLDLARVGLDELCDTLLARLAGDAGEDDVALIAVRTYPKDAPQPLLAGPTRLPPSPF